MPSPRTTSRPDTRSTSACSTPATSETSSVTDRTQCSQVMPFTAYSRTVSFWLIGRSSILRRGMRWSLAYPWGVVVGLAAQLRLEPDMPTHTQATRGYSATKDQLQARLKRIEGQVRGVQGMVEDERYCIDVLTQISAIQAALDKVALGLMDEHARHCVAGAVGEDRVAKTDELMAAVARLMRRG